MSPSNNTPENTVEDKRSFVQRLISIKPTDIITLIIFCVVAGLVLGAFNVDPADLWVDFFGTLFEAWDRFLHIITESFGWSVRYFFLGAVLVVPIWILWRVLSALNAKR
ncbi:DUF6460 domain-containing protein [Woodsholea maritima]|uniref:DUF6460 domain-containing protein n=1 Tax=Woodsholea maritima TaxID=240237 RepID=UPI00037499F8|nr:DUF6460 domain-containing protein [Woodsholea maritima]